MIVAHGMFPATCPVRATRAWLDALAAEGIHEGALLRHVDRHGNLREHHEGAGDRLRPQAVADIVQEYATRAGLDPSQYAGHSLRAGFLTQAARRGKSLAAMMAHSRHKTPAVALGYVREIERWRDPASKDLGL